MVAGSMWRLMFDDRYGPINQIIGWVAGERVSLLWTIKVALAYPAIIICDVWQWTPFMFIILLAALANVDQRAARRRRDRRRQPLAGVPQRHPAGDLAGDDDRAPDPRRST